MAEKIKLKTHEDGNADYTKDIDGVASILDASHWKSAIKSKNVEI